MELLPVEPPAVPTLCELRFRDATRPGDAYRLLRTGTVRILAPRVAIAAALISSGADPVLPTVSDAIANIKGLGLGSFGLFFARL